MDLRVIKNKLWCFFTHMCVTVMVCHILIFVCFPWVFCEIKDKYGNKFSSDLLANQFFCEDPINFIILKD